ncbi:hypothetical protein [Methylobacterium segetis]|uniref:hypothetical protein n=1 Tax=Methylobacterium segetis TaxID=2488750 RepID=UPI001A9F07E8|nr:hypothetical protein [Methylobacterium segetis]
MVSLLPSPTARRRHGWLLGLPLLGLVWVAATLHAQPEVERAVEASARAASSGQQDAVDASGETWFRLTGQGRDLVVKGDAPDAASRERLLLRLAGAGAPRRVLSAIGLVEEVSPFVWTATRTREDRIDLSGSRPAEIGRTALDARLRAELPASVALADEARAVRGGPPDFPSVAAFALARLQALAPGGVATVRDTTLGLEGEAAGPDSYETLRADLANLPAGYSAGRVEIRPPRVAEFRFGVERRADGGLTLTGNVVSETARTLLRKAAQEVAEGASVEDRTRTARGLGEGIDPEALTRFTLQAAGLLREGSVTFDGARLSAAGSAVDGQAVAEIGVLLRERRPQGVAPGSLDLRAAPLSPYRVTLRRDGDGLTLAGHLPDAAARERVLAAIRPRFIRERIVDRTRLAEGAPPNLVAALETAIPQLALLASGELAVADRDIALTGTSLYPESGRRLRTSFPAALPAAWRATASVSTPGAPERREIDACRRDLAAETRAHPLHFAPGSSAFAADFYPVLDAIAALAKLCPDLRFEVAGHLDPPGSRRETPSADAGAVQTTASIDKDAAKEAAGRSAPGKDAAKGKDTAHIKEAAPGKDAKAGKAAADKNAKAAKGAKPAEAPVAESEPDIARLRAQAIVDYLLQAGAAADQVGAAAGAPEAGAQAIVFTLRG